MHRKSCFTRKNCGGFLESKARNFRHQDAFSEHNGVKGLSPAALPWSRATALAHRRPSRLPDQSALTPIVWKGLEPASIITTHRLREANTTHCCSLAGKNACVPRNTDAGCSLLVLAAPSSSPFRAWQFGAPRVFLQSPTTPSSSQVPTWTAPTLQNPCWCPHLQAVSLVLPLAFLYSFPSRMITGGSSAAAYVSVSPTMGWVCGTGAHG